MADELMWLRCTDATGPREWVSLADLVELLRPMLTPETADKRVAHLDARVQRAEAQLADSKQECAALCTANADLYRTMTEATDERDAARRELENVRRQHIALKRDLNDMRRECVEWREAALASAQRNAKAREALNEGVED